jgi:hypothetical protein
MAWIQIIEEHQADDALQREYEAARTVGTLAGRAGAAGYGHILGE